ncbi:PREDICTED: uncharacterized protein LOC109192291 [Ipomoea nil]|uniref:uncharacterized protein LOC109192291 n=1 Tax=Ipomoea nil TaxID=35883 RepID=UPI000900F7A6|nr:PREDICTED: uncharacterized protein LOC109192291 [Ipomoea nil]
MASHQRSCSSSDWASHGENVEYDSDTEGSEYNELSGDDDNVQNKDDIEFDEHIDYGVEDSGLINNLENEVGSKALQSDTFDPNLSDDASIMESDSDCEISGGLWTNFRASTDMNDPEFTLGMTFASKQEFKEAVHNYAIKNGKDMKFVKNDKYRFIVECKQEGCPFRISLRKVINSLSWRILTMEQKHDGCSWAFDNRMMNSTKIAKRWSKEINYNPDWKMLKFKEKVHDDDKFNMSERQTYRVLAKAKTILKGNEEENFNKLWSYELEIKRTNPMSRCFVQLSDLKEMNGDTRFLRFYMCWDACKKGFKYCRKLIGIDGTHLRTTTGGVLLSAVGIDSNDSIFPLCYAIVEKETIQSWTWFLDFMKTDLDITAWNEDEFTLISDKQKGLIQACKAILPKVEHRFCVRHLHGNMKVAGFQGKSLKDALWSCARAYTVTDFNRGFRRLNELDGNAFEWLADKHPKEWSRSHFSCASQSDMLVNNICECFNSVISEARQ